MIKIEVDEAYAFDMLAITEVKARYGNTGWEQYQALYEQIISALDEKMTNFIVHSDEYHKLFGANLDVFKYIEELNKGNLKITGLKVHHANMDRYKYKRDLQNKFFNSELTEQKTKY